MLLLVGVGRGTWSPRMWVGEAHINSQADSTAIWLSCRHQLRQLSSYERFVACSCSRKRYPYPKGQVAKDKWCSEISVWGEPGACDEWGHAAEELSSTGSLAPLAASFLGSWLQTSTHSGKPLKVNQAGTTRPAMSPRVDNWLGFGDLFSGCGQSAKWRGGVGRVAGRGQREQLCVEEGELLQEGEWGWRIVVQWMKLAVLMCE